LLCHNPRSRCSAAAAAVFPRKQPSITRNMFTRMQTPVIEVKNLTKHYGEVVAIEGLGFDVPHGAICGATRRHRRGQDYYTGDPAGTAAAYRRTRPRRPEGSRPVSCMHPLPPGDDSMDGGGRAKQDARAEGNAGSQSRWLGEGISTNRGLASIPSPCPSPCGGGDPSLR
jgi:hypothetical protein